MVIGLRRMTPHRWFQFRLRTVMIVMTVCAIALGIVAQRARRTPRAVAIVLRHGGEVVFTHERRTGDGHDVSPAPGPAWLRAVMGENAFADIREVKAGQFDQTLNALRGMTTIQRLKTTTPACWPHASEWGFESLATLTGLQALDLHEAEFGDAELAMLTPLTQLRELNLSETSVTDDGIETLAHFPRLQILDLSHTKISGAGLPAIAGLKQLESLNLAGLDLREVDLGPLASLAKLKSLDLSDCQLEPQQLAALAAALTAAPALVDLNLGGMKVNVSVLKAFGYSRTLEYISTGFADYERAPPAAAGSSPPKSAGPSGRFVEVGSEDADFTDQGEDAASDETIEIESNDSTDESIVAP